MRNQVYGYDRKRTGVRGNNVTNIITHVVYVIDGSSSMQDYTSAVVRVIDGQVKYLARRSQELGHETRVSVYVFADGAQCVIYDKDVLRLPSIADFYRPHGWTALADATLMAVEDLKQTATLHGDHSFLFFVVTDGQENASENGSVRMLPQVLGDLPEEWTLGCLVPDAMGVAEAKRFGFPVGNIEKWDTTSERGVEEMGERVQAATENYMTSRASGVRGTRTLFGMKDVNATTIAQAGMKPLSASDYVLVPVARTPDDDLRSGEDPLRPEIRPFVERAGMKYTVGCAFYQLGKRETVQGNKRIAIVEKKTGQVYVDGDARNLIGLGGDTKRVGPDFHPEYELFVQSTSVNRKLQVGTKLLVLK
jgi:hypothetical protein